LLCLPRTPHSRSESFPMRRRRRDPRYLLASPWEGTLRIPGEVVIERRDDERDELWVISNAPAHREELLTLDVSGPETLTVRVVESRPVLVDGGIRHRLRLSIVS
jgi:hypothetical protein